MKTRMISASVLALVVGFAVLAPTAAFAQHVKVFDGHTAVYLPAADSQLLRVTIGNPTVPDSTSDQRSQAFVIEFDRPIDPVVIKPGESFTYTLDPREVGVVVDGRPGQRHVSVGFQFKTEVVEGMTTPQPSLTIEVLNRRTGEVMSFYAFPGFTGGVRVAG